MVKFRNNNLKYDFYKPWIKSENSKILNNIKGYLIQYYLASKESELNISLIKFWTLCEKILKDIGEDKNYNTLVKYMEKVLKYYNYPKNMFKTKSFTLKIKEMNSFTTMQIILIKPIEILLKL